MLHYEASLDPVPEYGVKRCYRFLLRRGLMGRIGSQEWIGSAASSHRGYWRDAQDQPSFVELWSVYVPQFFERHGTDLRRCSAMSQLHPG